MDIRTITYHGSHNYGAMLQAHALCKYLSDKGHNVKIIDYMSDADIRSNSVLKKGHDVRTIVKNIYNFRYWGALKCRYQRFEAFKKEYMMLTEQYSKASMKNYVENVDLYIAGSDQIWNCMNHVEELFFLDFNTGKARRVSYAASIGISEIPQNRREKVGSLLKKFDLISVREQEAQSILERQFGIASTVVCDPVLLLEKDYWGQLAGNKPIISEKYILCYCLGNIQETNECLNRLRNKWKLPIVLLSGSGYTKIVHDKVIRDAGPLQFLNLIRYAEFVVCSSFHGTVFSTIFSKNFTSVIDKVKPSRVKEYLNRIGLNDCIYSDETKIEENINYEPVNKKMEKYIENSIEFLNKEVLGEGANETIN